MHAEDALPGELDERPAHELRPADDEDQLWIEGNERQRPSLPEFTSMVSTSLGTEPGGDLVERALAGAVRVDRAPEA